MASPAPLTTVRRQVQISIPFWFLRDRYLDLFCNQQLNPEIGLDGSCLDQLRPEDFQAIADRLQNAGLRLTLHAPFQDLLPGALDRKILAASRARLHQAFDLVPLFRPRTVVCHLGYEDRHYAGVRDRWLANSLETWRPLAERAAAAGAVLALENVYETDPSLPLELLHRLAAPNVCLCLDVGHLHAFGGGDFSLWLRTLSPYIGQLHLHDNHGHADEHLGLGRGRIPFDEILSFFGARSQPPVITLEPHQEHSLWPSLEYLAARWPWSGCSQ